MEIYHPKDDELLREMKRVRRVKKRNRLFWGFLIWLLLSAVFGWFAFNKYCTLSIMHGSAMGDTLPDGSLTLVLRDKAENYQRGDIILYETDDGYRMKRIAALPGDQVVVDAYGDTRVNGKVPDEPYAIGRNADAGVTTRRLQVQENELFVQGDQRSLSVDNRRRDVEPVTMDKVTGRVVFTLWPLYKIGDSQPESRKAAPGTAGQTQEAGQ